MDIQPVLNEIYKMRALTIQSTLPKKEFWTSKELSIAFGVSQVSVQRCAKKWNIGRIHKQQRGATGIRIFVEKDLPLLCEHIHPRSKQ